MFDASGFVSYREESEGTWFIKALCQVFTTEACMHHVHKLFQKVMPSFICYYLIFIAYYHLFLFIFISTYF